MKKIDNFSEVLCAGKSKTLVDPKSEVNAKIYIKAKDDLKLVNVDHALIDQSIDTKKCDFMVLGINSNKTHMIELKGINIEEAFKQISNTIEYLFHDPQLNYCVILREVLDAYIASPERQKVPNIPSTREKELAKKLVRGNKHKPDNIFDLIHFVKVVKNQRRAAQSGRQIIISGRAPLELD